MPLLDHFHPPLLNQSPGTRSIPTGPPDSRTPQRTVVVVGVHRGGAYPRRLQPGNRCRHLRAAASARPASPPNGSPVATLPPPTWTPPPYPAPCPPSSPTASRCASSPRLAASPSSPPSNSSAPATRTEPTSAGLRRQVRQLSPSRGRSIVIDIVTNRRTNLHNETMRLMERGGGVPLAGRSGVVRRRLSAGAAAGAGRRSTCGRRPSPSVSRCRRCRCG